MQTGRQAAVAGRTVCCAVATMVALWMIGANRIVGAPRLALSSAARATNDSPLPRVPGMEPAASNRSGNAISACGPLQHGSSKSAILYAASSSPMNTRRYVFSPRNLNAVSALCPSGRHNRSVSRERALAVSIGTAAPSSTPHRRPRPRRSADRRDPQAGRGRSAGVLGPVAGWG